MALSLFGIHPGESLLTQAFEQAFEGAAAAELALFLDILPKFRLPFGCFFDQLRRMDCPGYPSFECGLPPTFYYFVPNTKWGSDKPVPIDALSPDFMYSTDGFGLNLGCPLRLHAALKILNGLPPLEVEECKQQLALSHQHLSIVEELLWLEIWKGQSHVTRSENEPGKRHDWKVFFDSTLVRLECKFRQLDWARMAFGNDFIPMKGFLLAKASKQLPANRDTATLNVVGITGMARVDEKFRSMVACELSTSPCVDVLVFRNLANEIVVFSLSETKLRAVSDLIAPQPVVPYQPFGRVFVNRAERQRRREACATSPILTAPPGTLPPLFEFPITNLASNRKYFIPKLPYRFGISGRLPSGEPQFTVIAPFLPAKSNE
jgi:hypothetical protein